MSYGADQIEQYRRAAGYVDCILKGTKPSDLLVQAPIKYRLVVNMKTAKALAIKVSHVSPQSTAVHPGCAFLSRHGFSSGRSVSRRLACASYLTAISARRTVN